ncbi:hypothetical protein [Streptomyces cavernae]|uniref:hypothetical protein n=1 Tax=Streptomyces cavernae TaxID=2259034 RepID=UPI00192E308D|nr:hypothetical protein [Streptomyces cavernae]
MEQIAAAAMHFLAAVRTSRAALPSLLRRRGALVNISSNGAPDSACRARPLHHTCMDLPIDGGSVKTV